MLLSILSILSLLVILARKELVQLVVLDNILEEIKPNACTLGVMGDMFPLLPTCSPAAMSVQDTKLQHAMDHSGTIHSTSIEPASSPFHPQACASGLPLIPSSFVVNADYMNSATIEKKEDPFSDEAGVPDLIVRRGLEAQERLKCIRPAHSASRFVEDLLHNADGVEQSMNQDPKSINNETTQTVDDSTFYDHFQPKPRFTGGRSFPTTKRSVTAPAAVSSFFSTTKKDRTMKNDKQVNQSNSCTPTPSGPSTPRCETISNVSPFDILNTVISQEDIKSEQEEEGKNSKRGKNQSNRRSSLIITDYNRHINFSQFDLRLDNYGDEDNDRLTTSIPLPQMSWFPEPTTLCSSSNLSHFKLKVSDNGKKKKNERPTTSDGISYKKMSWNLIGRGKGKVSKNTIGYPSVSSSS